MRSLRPIADRPGTNQAQRRRDQSRPTHGGDDRRVAGDERATPPMGRRIRLRGVRYRRRSSPRVACASRHISAANSISSCCEFDDHCGDVRAPADTRPSMRHRLAWPPQPQEPIRLPGVRFASRSCRRRILPPSTSCRRVARSDSEPSSRMPWAERSPGPSRAIPGPASRTAVMRHGHRTQRPCPDHRRPPRDCARFRSLIATTVPYSGRPDLPARFRPVQIRAESPERCSRPVAAMLATPALGLTRSTGHHRSAMVSRSSNTAKRVRDGALAEDLGSGRCRHATFRSDMTHVPQAARRLIGSRTTPSQLVHQPRLR